jgi:DNA-binding LacI/PurR family transcriptional regulator
VTTRSAESPRPPTLDEVAAAAGVSRATVSRVINGIRNVDPKLHEAVWSAVGATRYVPNRMARSLVTRRTGTIAFVVSDSEPHDDDPFMTRLFSDPYFGRVVGGLMSVLRTEGMQLGLHIVGSEDMRARLVGDLRQGHADGAIVLSLPAHDTLPGLLTQARIPATMIGRPGNSVPISYVDVANAAGAALAADHLVRRGCSRIGMLTGPVDVPASQERMTGFRNALARHGNAYVPMAVGNFTRVSGEEAMRGLLATEPDLDGVFAANDLMAQGAIAVLHESGRRVPDDVAVIGFDDSSAALACRPLLTTVRHPLEQMAAMGARMLLDSIEQPAPRPTCVIYDPELVRRASA